MNRRTLRCRWFLIRSTIQLFLVASLLTAAHATERSVVHAIFKTTDRGRSWSRSDRGMPGDSRINAFGSSGRTIFVGTDSGIFISRDEGMSWQASAGAGTTSGRVLCFTVVEQTVYAGTESNGLLTSSDNGTTWSLNPSFPRQKVRCLLGHRGKLYVGTDKNGVHVSNDGGQSWTRIHQGLPPNVQIFAMAIVKNKLFAGLYGSGLYVFDYESLQWTKAGNVSPLGLTAVGETLVAGHNPGGIHWSDDLGATWSQGTANLAPDSPAQGGELSSEAPVWELASNGNLSMAGASNGIYYSEDHGHTWTRSRAGLPPESPGVSFLVEENLVLAGAIVTAK